MLATAPLSHAADLDEVQKRGELRVLDRTLLASLDDYVSSMRRTSTWSRLVVKYFGDEAPEILKRAREEAERQARE